jgi:hypothetical protein
VVTVVIVPVLVRVIVVSDSVVVELVLDAAVVVSG